MSTGSDNSQRFWGLEKKWFHQFLGIGNQDITFFDGQDLLALELSQYPGGRLTGDSRHFGQFTMGQMQVYPDAVIGGVPRF